MPSFFSDPTTSTATTLMYNNTNDINSNLAGYSVDIAANYSNNVNNYNGFSNFSAITNSVNDSTRTAAAAMLEQWSSVVPNSSLTANVSQFPLSNYRLNSNAKLETSDLSTTPALFDVNTTPLKIDTNSISQCSNSNNNNSTNLCNKDFSFAAHLSAMYCDNNNNGLYTSSNGFSVSSNSSGLRLFPSQTRANLPYKTGPGSNSTFFLIIIRNILQIIEKYWKVVNR